MSGQNMINGVSNGYDFDNSSETKMSSGVPNESFLRQLFEVILKDGIAAGTNPNSKVVEFVHPLELKKQIDVQLKDEGDSDERLLELCRDTLNYSVRTGHPHFFNQLYGGFDAYGVGGAWLTEAANTSQYTFEVAPVFTLMEQVVLGKMCDLIGFPDGDGVFCPGGSISNTYGLNLARYNRFPQVKEEGMQGLPQICLFTSEQSHYSMKKGAALLGIGINAIRTVPCDARGKMIPALLEKLVIQAEDEGLVPLMVNATSGTTVLGAYDPLNEIADVCSRHNMWLHVDAAWGGGALLSEKYKYLCEGINRVDSVAWNAHKMMGAPLQCCAFLTRHQGLLQRAHSANARYLFQQDKFYDVSYDTGDKVVQCGRKIDVFKLWLMWRAKGNKGFASSINNAFDCARYLVEQLKQNDGFRLVLPEFECTNVCFWYIPMSMRNQEETPAWWERLSKVAPMIKERMVKEGTLLIGYQPQGDKVNFFRMVVSNLNVTHKEMDFVISEIERLGLDL